MAGVEEFPIRMFSRGRVRKLLAALVRVWIPVTASPFGFRWAREGHEVVALIAEQNMTPAGLERAKAILGDVSLEK